MFGSPRQPIINKTGILYTFSEVNDALDSIIESGVREELFQRPIHELQKKSAYATLIIGVSALLKPEEFGNSSAPDTTNYCRNLFIQILHGIPTC